MLSNLFSFLKVEASDSQDPKSPESKTESGGVLVTGIENATSTECLDETYASGDIIASLIFAQLHIYIMISQTSTSTIQNKPIYSI